MGRLVTRCAVTAVGVLVFSALSCGGNNSTGTSTAPTVTGVDPSSGPPAGGTAVVIAGTNFQNGATVQFGSVQATFVGFNSATSLSASAPAGVGSVAVTVTNPDGQKASLPSGFTYLGSGCSVPAAITSNLTLDTSCVWIAPQTVVVGGSSSPVLTVLPGATVMFASGAALRVGTNANPGGLVATGTGTAAGETIVFTSVNATPAPGDWGGVVIGSQALSTTSIAYATISYAGASGANDISDAAALTVEGGDVAGGGSTSPAPVLTNLTISNSAGHGLVFAGLTTGFTAGSGSITVTDWEMTAHYPFVIEANEGGTIPASISAPSTPPSATAGVAFNSYVSLVLSVISSETWPTLPLPFVVLLPVEVGAAAENPAATLTIAAPNKLEFATGAEIDVDPDGNGTGFLTANGTNSGSGAIVFTTNSTTPTPGAWGGINFAVWSGGQASSSLSHVLIDYANNTLLGPPPAYGTGAIAVANATGNASAVSGPAIANCQIENYPSYGIVLIDISSSDFTAYGNNTFGTPTLTVSSFCSPGDSDCTDTGPGP